MTAPARHMMDQGRLGTNQPDEAGVMPNLLAITAYLKQEIPADHAATLLYDDQIWEAHVANAKDLLEHQDRVAELTVALARKNPEIPEEEITFLYLAAKPHDMGKFALDLKKVFKPSKLTAEEFEHIKLHAQLSSDLVRNMDPTVFTAMVAAYNKANPNAPLVPAPETRETVDKVAELILKHHEYEDGTGYPHGLRAQVLSESSKTLTVADVYDALTNKRCYHEAMSRTEAIACMRDEGGGKFDFATIDRLEEVTTPKLVGAKPLRAPADRWAPHRPTSGMGAHRIPGLVLILGS